MEKCIICFNNTCTCRVKSIIAKKPKEQPQLIKGSVSDGVHPKISKHYEKRVADHCNWLADMEHHEKTR